MKPFSSNFVQANGIRIHYYRSTPPGGGPPVVLLHGMTDNGLCWARVAATLEETYDVVMPDARGHGLSEKSPAGYAREDRAADAAALIDALGLDRPALVGHSLGGETALAAAALYPGKVRAAVLEDPALFPDNPDPAGQEAGARSWVAELDKHQAMPREALVAECLRANPAWHPDDAHAWAGARLQMSREALYAIFAAMGGSWQELMRAVECPLLLVTGEPGRVIISPEMVKEAAGLWQQGQEAHIPGAGHSIHREQFEAFVEKVKAFLDQYAKT